KDKDKNLSLEQVKNPDILPEEIVEEGRRKKEEGRGKKWMDTQTSTNFKHSVDNRLFNPKDKDKNPSLEQLENQDILPEEIIQELVNQAEAIEEFFHGLPQDIEWCWDGEKVWILQSRPITNLRPIWTRTIAAEVIPGAIHPLTWSINRPLTCGVWGEIFTIVLGEKVANLDFTETATLLGSHAYFNATLLGEIFRMMGLPEQGLEFLLRGQKMGKPPLRKVWSALPGLWRLIQKEIAVDNEFERDYHQIFVPALESLENNFKQNSSQSLSELLDIAERIQISLIPITFYNILGPIGLAIRRSLFSISEEWLPTDTAPEIVSIRELQQLAVKLKMTTNSDGEIEAEFDKNRELQKEFQQWLESYGYLSEVGTDISVATWGEKPDNFRDLLFAMAQNQLSVNSYQLSVNTVNSLNLWQRWRLAQCAKRARTKGKIAEVYGKLLAYLRQTFLAIEKYGLEVGIFEQKGDIFYLEFAEIRQWILSKEKNQEGSVGWLEGENSTKRCSLNPLEKEGMTESSVGWVDEGNPTNTIGVEEYEEMFEDLFPLTPLDISPTPQLPSPPQLKQLIRQRKEQLEKDGDRQVPSVVYGNVLPQESRETFSSEENVSILQGIPGSVGCVEGYVKICRSLEVNLAESENLIIVVPYTDAGWAPLLLKAKGIIAEVGGQLSHGAIIAREYGIPAVMNISGAMTRLQDGQKVRVDGYRGTVELLS
ncbi:PEP-utilizing enzyme, partial [Hydrocoleum sp. CS-953]|uniref:PEP-utilizing enzyme n=2 Tax=Microcoleaceae TaxID=1892252 RepID=UPI001FED2D58